MRSQKNASRSNGLFGPYTKAGLSVVTGTLSVRYSAKSARSLSAFVYGPNNPFDREAFFWDRILAGRPIIVPEDGSRRMQWVHSHDVGRAAVLAADNDIAIGRAYNVTSDQPITQIDLVKLLARIADKPANLVHVPRAKIQAAGGGLLTPPFYFGVYLDLPPIIARADRVRSQLGLEFTPLEEGLRETYRWYQRQQRPEPDYSWEDHLLQ
jgi:nucleoside-diphosphate-sugar epimerase